jgi:hypothetical protein
MTEPSAESDEPDAGTPRWVKVLAILVLLLVLLVAVLHLTGTRPGGSGSHLGLAVGQDLAQDMTQEITWPC